MKQTYKPSQINNQQKTKYAITEEIVPMGSGPVIWYAFTFKLQKVQQALTPPALRVTITMAGGFSTYKMKVFTKVYKYCHPNFRETDFDETQKNEGQHFQNEIDFGCLSKTPFAQFSEGLSTHYNKRSPCELQELGTSEKQVHAISSWTLNNWGPWTQKPLLKNLA